MRMLIAATRRLGASRRGSTLVESALVLGLFVQMIFGIMEAARFMYFYNWVSYAAREGTRYACVRGTSSTQPASASDIQTFIMNQAVTYDPSNVTVATTWLPNNSRGSTVAVKVSYAYHPLIGIIFPAAMSLSATSKMVISQ